MTVQGGQQVCGPGSSSSSRWTLKSTSSGFFRMPCFLFPPVVTSARPGHRGNGGHSVRPLLPPVSLLFPPSVHFVSSVDLFPWLLLFCPSVDPPFRCFCPLSAPRPRLFLFLCRVSCVFRCTSWRSEGSPRWPGPSAPSWTWPRPGTPSLRRRPLPGLLSTSRQSRTDGWVDRRAGLGLMERQS